MDHARGAVDEGRFTIWLLLSTNWSDECSAGAGFLFSPEMKDFSAQFRALIEAELPEGSRIVMPRSDEGLMILATWRLPPDDPYRPDKRSRMVRIEVSPEALEDYAAGTDGVRMVSNERLIAWLRCQLAVFDPRHDAPLGVAPAPVTWPLGTRELNG